MNDTNDEGEQFLKNTSGKINHELLSDKFSKVNGKDINSIDEDDIEIIKKIILLPKFRIKTLYKLLFT